MYQYNDHYSFKKHILSFKQMLQNILIINAFKEEDMTFFLIKGGIFFILLLSSIFILIMRVQMGTK